MVIFLGKKWVEGLIALNDHESTSAVGIFWTDMLVWWNFGTFGDGKIMSSCLCILCILCIMCILWLYCAYCDYTILCILWLYCVYWWQWSGNFGRCRNDGNKAREQGNEGDPRCWSGIAIDDCWMRWWWWFVWLLSCLLTLCTLCTISMLWYVFARILESAAEENSDNSSVGKRQLYCFSRSLRACFGWCSRSSNHLQHVSRIGSWNEMRSIMSNTSFFKHNSPLFWRQLEILLPSFPEEFMVFLKNHPRWGDVEQLYGSSETVKRFWGVGVRWADNFHVPVITHNMMLCSSPSNSQDSLDAMLSSWLSQVNFQDALDATLLTCSSMSSGDGTKASQNAPNFLEKTMSHPCFQRWSPKKHNSKPLLVSKTHH